MFAITLNRHPWCNIMFPILVIVVWRLVFQRKTYSFFICVFLFVFWIFVFECVCVGCMRICAYLCVFCLMRFCFSLKFFWAFSKIFKIFFLFTIFGIFWFFVLWWQIIKIMIFFVLYNFWIFFFWFSFSKSKQINFLRRIQRLFSPFNLLHFF